MSSGVAAEIKSKLPVIEVIGETVVLKRAGSAYKGLCPFHAEKTPSFVVTPDRETWHCFGCGEHGDIFTFLMRRDGLEFRETLERLAERAGVELSERSAQEDRLRRRLREALEAAIAWYREVLLQARQAQAAREYLVGRGLTAETQDRFGLGYAPNTWDALVGRLRKKGFSDAELTGAGLAGTSGRGGVYDRFRGRIIIPIRDASGRPVGLGGRIMPGAEGPKYLNSPGTPLFDKSRTLYAIDLAKAAIRREKLAVIVEGYTDVMAAHRAGFQNVVASLGTALTGGQVELATRYADAVALAYDVDLAGEAATQRGLLDELGPDTAVGKVRVIRIPAGKDPDELVRSDPDAWRAAVTDATPVMDYFMDRAAAAVDLTTASGRREVAERVIGLLRRVANPIERDAHVPRLARLTGIDERVLRDELARAPRTQEPVRIPAAEHESGETPTLTPLEREALVLALRYPVLAAELPPDDPLPLRDQVARALADAWLSRVRAADGATPDLAAFVAELDPVRGGLARSLLATAEIGGPRHTADSARRALRDCRLRLVKVGVEESIHEMQALIRAAEPEGPEQMRTLQRQYQQLQERREQINRDIAEPAVMAGTGRS
jgi:DNA primase